MDAAFWDDRYAAEEYAYGETPNAGVAKILEAYTPAQLALGTGGPKAPELLMTLDSLHEELSGLEFKVAREIDRDVTEGSFHQGQGAVVQILARLP